MMRTRSRGFTLVELLVVIAIIAVLTAMMLPAVQASRDVARRTACANNLMRLSMALQNYESANQVLPAGVTNPTGPVGNLAVGQNLGWTARLLPYLDEKNVFDRVDLAASAYGPQNALARATALTILVCPAESGEMQHQLSQAAAPADNANAAPAPAMVAVASSNYAGCHHDVEAPIDADNNGVLFLNSQIHLSEVTDGLAQTIFIGEKQQDPADLGWISGNRATLRNTGTAINDTPITGLPPAPAPAAKEKDAAAETPAAPTPALYVGGFGSYHSGGIAQFAFGDGSVKAISDTISPRVYALLGNRADHQIVDESETNP